MVLRRIAAVWLVGSLLLAGGALGQAPKEAPKKPGEKPAVKPAEKGKEMEKKPGATAKPGDPPPPANPDDANKIEEQAFKSADGVKLRGLWYKSAAGSAPVVLLLHAYGADPSEAKWDDIARKLQAKYNVFRFDFRGHGKSTEVVPGEFWANAYNKTGASNTSSAQVLAGKSKVSYKEFKPGYYPQLVQDIAAARNVCDQLNDTGSVNTSTIYLMGTGDAVNLGMLYLSSEWVRERIKPNTALSRQFVSPRIGTFPQAEVAGLDFGGAVWLSPTPTAKVTTNNLKDMVLSNYAINLRSETPMLFLHGKKDTKSASFSKTLYTDVVAAKAKSNPNAPGIKIAPQDNTYVREIDGTGDAGLNLWEGSFATEKLVTDFMTFADGVRLGRARKVREWDRPVLIVVQDFGVGR